MDKTTDRRRENRLRYHWPIWFAEDFGERLSQGQMVDVSSSGAAFTCYADQGCPCPGQELTARFSVPFFEEDESFDMTSFTKCGYVHRVDHVNDFLRRVAVQFSEPLPFNPGEQPGCETSKEHMLKAQLV